MKTDIYKNDLDGGRERIGCIVLLLMTAVLFVCSLCVMLKGCGRQQKVTDGEVRYKYIYVRDTVRKHMYFDRPVPVTETVPVLDTIVIRDTVEILRDYFTERTYRYEYSDTDICLTSDIVVSGNGLRTVSTDYELYRRQLTIEKTVTRQPKFRLGIGAGVATDFKGGWDCDLTASVGIRRHGVSVVYGVRGNRLSVGYRYDIISR